MPDNGGPKMNSSLLDVILHDGSVRRTPADERKYEAAAALQTVLVITSDDSAPITIQSYKARLMLYLAIECQIRPTSRKV